MCAILNVFSSLTRPGRHATLLPRTGVAYRAGIVPCNLAPGENTNMAFILLGFSQEDTVRHFAFERIGADGTRGQFKVDADLRMVKEFNIKVQELPLICRRMLESQPVEMEAQDLTLTEDNMRLFAEPIVVAAKRGPKKVAVPAELDYRPAANGLAI